MLPFYRRPITRKTVFIVLLTPIIAAAIPAFLWLGWNARPLHFESEYSVQTPKLPTPNAHEIYLQADKAISMRIGREKPVSRVLDYEASEDDSKDAQTYPLAGKKRWLLHNKKGLELLENALRAEYYFPPVRSAQPRGDIESPSHLRSLAKYMTVQSEVLAAEGDSEMAVHKSLDAWKMAIDATHGAPLVASLNAAVVESYARRAVDGEIGHLNGKQAANAARRLENLLPLRATQSEILQQERDAHLFQIKPGIEQAVHEEKREKEIAAAIERGETNFYSDGKPAPELRGPIINWSVRRMAQEYSRGMEVLLATSGQAWPQRNLQLPSDLNPKISRLIEVLAESRFHHARSQALGNIFLARFALHAYRKDKGFYPPSLQSLVPAYLKKAPPDPFSNNQGLRYEIAGKRYKLWSIGPDARDDNARPALNPNPRKPSGRYLVSMDSTGDIVAQISK